MSDNQTEINIKVEAADKGIVFPFLRIYEEEGPFLKSFKISSKVVTVGRDKSATLRVQDKYISRKHFQIEFTGHGKLFLQDLGSANGTFLNGKRVERSKLEDGDEIVVGEKRVVVSYKIPKPKIVPPKPAPARDAQTMPEVAAGAFGHEKTELAFESDIAQRETQGRIEPQPDYGPTKESKKLKVVTEVSRVAPSKAHETVAEDFEEDEEKSDDYGRVLDLPLHKERRSVSREDAFPEADEEKVRLSRVVMFFVAALMIAFISILSVRYASNYFKRPKADSEKLADVSGGTEVRQKERVVIPRPDVAVGSQRPAQAKREIARDSETLQDITKAKTPAQRAASEPRQREYPSAPTPQRTTAQTRGKETSEGVVTLGQQRITFRRKQEALRTPEPVPTVREQPTVVAEAVKDLQKKEVLNIDLNKASETLVASREITGGKETRKSREIDIKEVEKLIDVDVNLSIMSEEVMLSEKRDVKKFRETLKDKISAVSYCYQDALRANPEVAGRTKVNFTVVRGGRVSSADVSSSDVRDRNLNACIIKTVKNTVFDEPPHDNFTISYTFRFKKSTVDFTR